MSAFVLISLIVSASWVPCTGAAEVTSKIERISDINKCSDIALLLEQRKFTIGAELGVQIDSMAEHILNNWPSSKRYYLVDIAASSKSTPPVVELSSVVARNRRLKNKDITTTTNNNVEFIDIDSAPLNQTKKGIEKFGAVPVILKNNTENAAAIIPDSTLDFVYVDARHDYCGTIADIKAWWPKLKAGGIMAGHGFLFSNETAAGVDWTTCADGTKHYGAVKQAVREFAVKNNLRIHATTDDTPCWVFSTKRIRSDNNTSSTTTGTTLTTTSIVSSAIASINVNATTGSMSSSAAVKAIEDLLLGSTNAIQKISAAAIAAIQQLTSSVSSPTTPVTTTSSIISSADVIDTTTAHTKLPDTSLTATKTVVTPLKTVSVPTTATSTTITSTAAIESVSGTAVEFVVKPTTKTESAVITDNSKASTTAASVQLEMMDLLKPAATATTSITAAEPVTIASDPPKSLIAVSKTAVMDDTTPSTVTSSTGSVKDTSAVAAVNDLTESKVVSVAQSDKLSAAAVSTTDNKTLLPKFEDVVK